MKAIETKYRGYAFRSRLEARWAVVFENLNIRWQYEPEGYEFDDGSRYLPDFWLPLLDCFFEVKGGEIPPYDLERIRWLAEKSGKRVFVAGDIPPPAMFAIDASDYELACVYRESIGGEACWNTDHGYMLCRCGSCGQYGIEFGGRSERIKCLCPPHGDDGRAGESPEILAAYRAARSARFEYGEEPGRVVEERTGLERLKYWIDRRLREASKGTWRA